MAHEQTLPAEATFDEDRWLKMKPKVLGWIVLVVAIAVGSWIAIKADVQEVKKDVADHGDQLKKISEQLEVIKTSAVAARDSVTELRYEQKLVSQKLDYLTGDKRGPRPASTSP